MNFTPIARKLLLGAPPDAEVFANRFALAKTQLDVLFWLLDKGKKTAYGQKHNFQHVKSYTDFRQLVPVVEYPAIRGFVEEMVKGQVDVLWPGRCRRFAQSSGTSDGKSKYIPVTDDSLRLNHYAGGRAVVKNYLRLYPDSRLFSGDAFILGGSFANEVNDLPKGTLVGDLSAHLIDKINPLANLFRVPSKKVALMEDWHEKLPLLVKSSSRRNITNISGVPSWFLTVLKGVLEYTGADNIKQVWPNLEVFFHGGIAFGPYREQYRAITGPDMRYLETYNASEGFFGVQDNLHTDAMLLLARHGVFYEFLPLDSLGDPFPTDIVPLADVVPGKVYAMVITAPNGLWRYVIGDTVVFESVTPPRIRIAGRTKSFINAFGEELMVYNADAAIAFACKKTGAEVANYTVAPVFPENGKKGRHQWLIDFYKLPECGMDKFAVILDQALQKENSDYQAKRSGSIFLENLSITQAPAGIFDRWLQSTGKLGGQRKIPRLSNDRKIIDTILNLKQ